MTRILHTSDWHIGRTLYGRKRFDEFEAFLDWLVRTIQQERVDVLLVAGDVFDTATPNNTAQALYYRFLSRVSVTCCRHVVIIAGNHDSPSFLMAPKELLKALDVHVIGSISDNIEDEVLVLSDNDNVPELIVCAVPYLRDRDIRVVESGESTEDKERQLIEGIRNHYCEVVVIAKEKRDECLKHLKKSMPVASKMIPIVAMGHLFTAGGKTIEGDGVRELYVGSLAHVSAGIFPNGLDYLALGHLHVPQQVAGSDTIRYSGSPLPMSFGEAKQQKSVVIVDLNACAMQSSADICQPQIKLIPLPVFQKLERIKGNLQTILAEIAALASADSQAWLEVIYEGNEITGDLRTRLDEAVAGSQLEILRVKNSRVIDRVLGQIDAEETLDDLDVNDVFDRCLDMHNVPDEQRRDLIQAYQEVVKSLYEGDAHME
ncbi:MAG: exonuclease SbcCD subunit D C-terminal domain-containing protein [Burkholderiales bacterium]|nr:exonuclease SbcCD subunit D C-terminal domain-containing protein [Nitrosomonas sp.]MCP5274195.1 exonuclease SbcCD subunit D C-terminal domain-containing protein [Burkholderiales bacterium]